MPFVHESEMPEIYMKDVEMVPSYKFVSESDKPIYKTKHGEVVNSETIPTLAVKSLEKYHAKVVQQKDRNIPGVASVDDVDMHAQHSPDSPENEIERDTGMNLSSSSSVFSLDSSDDEKESPRKKVMNEISRCNQIKENSIHLNYAKTDMTKFIKDCKDCATVLNKSDISKVHSLPEQVQFIVNNEDLSKYCTVIDSSPLSVNDENISERVILESDLDAADHDDLMANINCKAETKLREDTCAEVDDSEEMVRRKNVKRTISYSSSDDEDNSRHLNLTSSSVFSSQSDNLTTQERVQLVNDLAKIKREMQALKEQLKNDLPKPNDQEIQTPVVEKTDEDSVEIDDVSVSDTESKHDLFLSQPTIIPTDCQEQCINSLEVRDHATVGLEATAVGFEATAVGLEATSMGLEATAAKADSHPESLKLIPTPIEIQTVPESKLRQTQSDINSVSGRAPSPVQKRALGIVTTGLTPRQIKETKKLAAANGVNFFTKFNEAVTHVVVKPVEDDNLLCNRTLKFFQGIAHKCWIVNYFWVVDSHKVGYLLHESPYEIQGDTAFGEVHQGPKRSRLSQDKLFSDFEFSLIGDDTDLPKEVMSELLQSCGGSVLDLVELGQGHPKLTSLIICCTDNEEGDSEGQREIESQARALYQKYQVITVTREWVLDSVTLYKLPDLNTYIITDINTKL